MAKITINSKVPLKLTKAQGDKYIKAHQDYIAQLMCDYEHDMNVNAHNMQLYYMPSTMKREDAEYKTTMTEYSSELREAFRTLIKIRNRVRAAIDRNDAAKKKGK